MNLKRRVILTLLTVATVTVLALPAGASTVVSGSTWYTNGTQGTVGTANTAVTVTARAVGAVPGVAYQLVSGQGTAQNPCSINVVPVNPTPVYASPTGLIGAVTGTINRPAGGYQVCFRAVDGSTTTAPVGFLAV